MLKYIEDLLQGAEVEWKPLGEVFELRNGYTPSKSNQEFWKNGTIPWFRMEDLRASKGILHDSIQHVSAQAIKGKGLFPKDSILLATTATIGEHALLATDALANQRFTNFAICEKFKTKLIPKFVYYYFFVIDEWCKQNITMGNFPSVNIAQLKKQSLPLPPLSVQAEIVRILDKFTSLEAELEAELDCRKRQYEHYRNQLLSFENTSRGGVNNVIWKPLGEVCGFITGFPFRSALFKEEGLPICKTTNLRDGRIAFDNMVCFNLEDYEQDLTRYLIFPGDIVIGMSGSIKVGINDTDRICYLNQRVGKFAPNTELLNNKYLYYFLCGNVEKLLGELGGGAVKNLSNREVNCLPIPLPPLPEQERIVGILDRFEALAHSMSEGLPREIALRRQQYEHYRRELLDFARPQS